MAQLRALAQKACRDGYTVYYARVPRLFAELELARGDGRFNKLFRRRVPGCGVGGGAAALRGRSPAG
ncbi:MAG: ATP-binding protein [Hyphomicrobiaceae bacterium]